MIMGHDYGMFLTDLVKINHPLQDEIYTRMMSLRDNSGSWCEYYLNDDKPFGTACHPWSAGTNIEAAISYAAHRKAGGVVQEVTHIQIDAELKGPVISPLLFGHNLEHTRRAIWQGISAEMIDNRKFAATDCGLPMGWTTLTGRGVSIDDKVAYAGSHSVRLENNDGTSCGIWQQHNWLAFRKDVKYAFRVWTKSDADQAILLSNRRPARFPCCFFG